MVATLSQRSRLNPAVLCIQARQLLFGSDVLGRHLDRERGPLQNALLLLLKASRHETSAPLWARGEWRVAGAGRSGGGVNASVCGSVRCPWRRSDIPHVRTDVLCVTPHRPPQRRRGGREGSRRKGMCVRAPPVFAAVYSDMR